MVRAVWLILFSLFTLYSVLVYKQGGTGDSRPGEDALAGAKLWQEKNCQACHQLYGLGGYMGPDLTNIYSEPGKGPEYMRAFIRYGSRKMPNYQLSAVEVEQIICFLQWADQSGKSYVPATAVHWSGTYVIK